MCSPDHSGPHLRLRLRLLGASRRWRPLVMSDAIRSTDTWGCLGAKQVEPQLVLIGEAA